MNLVYTAIYGGYDKLWQPRKAAEGWKYRCYTDKPLDGKMWKIINNPLPYDTTRNGRFIKITHCMQGFDNILWIDGCVEIKGDLNEFIKKLPKSDLVVSKHPFLNSLHGELKACMSMGKDDADIMKKQVKDYGKVKEYVHPQTTIILRKKDMKFSTIWWNEVKNKSKRDQLSFGYSIQESGQEYKTVNWEFMEKYFVWHKYHNK